MLLVPGGLDGAASVESPRCVLPAASLARRGIAALVFSPSGREDAPGRSDRNGPLHQDEAAAALRALLGCHEVDPTRVVVLSLSFGVVMAMGALVRHPRLSRGLRGLIDWEGPGSRRWFAGVPFGEDHTEGVEDDAFWEPREAIRMAPRLGLPYRRFQSTWDHVHGPRVEIGLELARAVAAGDCPEVRLMHSRPPLRTAEIAWGPDRIRAQCRVLQGWVEEMVAPR